jgi:hypothetical protein
VCVCVCVCYVVFFLHCTTHYYLMSTAYTRQYPLNYTSHCTSLPSPLHHSPSIPIPTHYTTLRYVKEDALKLCEQHGLYREMVYILRRLGQTDVALTMIIDKLQDIKEAIE